MSARFSVILVREQEGQTSGSGCCGRLEGDFLSCEGKPLFPEKRAVVESMGSVYRALREAFGEDVEIEVVDPRNFIGMAFLLIRDARRFGVGFGQTVRTLSRIGPQAVVANGRLLARGTPSDVAALVAAIGAVPSRAAATG